MISKGLVVILFVSFALSYEKDGNILVLKEGDFPQVINEHKYIFINFYAQWYISNYAGAIIASNQHPTSPKLQMNLRPKHLKNENVSAMFEIEGYPKMVLFYNSERIDYQQQRTTFYITKWLEKVLSDPLKPIDEEAYKQLQDSQQSAIVFHGSPSSFQASILRKTAYTDAINNYYFANVGKKENSIEIFRPVHPTLTNEWIDQNIKLWIQHNQRPIVRKFDDHVISLIFDQKKIAMCLFNLLQADWLNEALKQSARKYYKSGKQMIFANVEVLFYQKKKNGEHFTKFGQEFLQIDPSQIALVIIDAGDDSKYALVKDPESLTVYDIMKFLQDWESKKLRRYKLPDQISKNKPVNQQKNTQNLEGQQKKSEQGQSRNDEL